MIGAKLCIRWRVGRACRAVNHRPHGGVPRYVLLKAGKIYTLLYETLHPYYIFFTFICHHTSLKKSVGRLHFFHKKCGIKCGGHYMKE